MAAIFRVSRCFAFRRLRRGPTSRLDQRASNTALKPFQAPETGFATFSAVEVRIPPVEPSVELSSARLTSPNVEEEVTDLHEHTEETAVGTTVALSTGLLNLVGTMPDGTEPENICTADWPAIAMTKTDAPDGTPPQVESSPQDHETKIPCRDVDEVAFPFQATLMSGHVLPARRPSVSEYHCEEAESVSYTHLDVYKRQGIKRERIKSAISFLASLSLVYVEQLPSQTNSFGISNAYRIVGIDSFNHRGTRGRGGDEADTF